MRLILVSSIALAVAFGADDPQFKSFNKGVQDYVNVRKTVMSHVPPLSKKATPQEIDLYEKTMIAGLRTGRPNAKQGDVFTPEVQPLFAKILHQNLAGAKNKNSRSTAKIGNPTSDRGVGEAEPVVGVNVVYPKSAPLSSVPPKLLKQLPPLPMNIEYRFVGSTLILWDSLSNFVIDYMKEAAPEL
jgi:hypothetical protein